LLVGSCVTKYPLIAKIQGHFLTPLHHRHHHPHTAAGSVAAIFRLQQVVREYPVAGAPFTAAQYNNIHHGIAMRLDKGAFGT